MSPDPQWRQRLRLSASGYILVLLTIAAAILRLLFLNSKSIWLDEAMTAKLAAGTLGSHLRPLFLEEVNMVLYYVVVHLWTQLAGFSEISLRLPSVIFATATVPLIYALGVELCDRRVGLLAALLLCVNVSCIQFAQQARSYAMVGMMVTLSSLLFVRSIKRTSPVRLREYVIAGPLAAYSHLFGILILPAQWLSLFLFRLDRKTTLQLTACIALVAMLSLPVAILSMLGDYSQVSWIPATTARTVIHTFAMFCGLYWGNLSSTRERVLFATYLVSIGIAVVGASKSQRPVIGYLLLSAVLPVGIVIVLSMFKPLFIERYLLICQPFVVLVAAIGVARIKPRAVMAAVIVLIVALSLYEDLAFYESGPMEDWRGLIAFVAANAKPGDVMLVYPEWEKNPVDYYVGRLAGPAGFRVITDRFYTFEHDVAAAASDDRAATVGRFLAKQGVTSYTRLWIASDIGHADVPAVRFLKAGHQITAGPPLAGLSLTRID